MEAKAIAAIRAGEKELSDYGYASTSEWLTIMLALAQYDELFATYAIDRGRAWDRLDNSQRRLVQAENPDFRGRNFSCPRCPTCPTASRRRGRSTWR